MTLKKRFDARVAILLLGLAAYSPSLSTGFLYDDHLLIESNAALRSWSLGAVKKDFTSGVFGHQGEGIDFYRPLQTLSTRIEYRLWKLNPLPYHMTNLLLQLGNGLLLYAFVLALGFGALTAGVAGCLFVVHPIIVEGLLMVSGRGELLAFFFSMGCLTLALRGSPACLFLSLLSYLLALFSKESAAIAPALLAAAFYCRGDPLKRYAFLIPMAALTGIYLGLRTYALGTSGIVWATGLPWRFYVMAFPQKLLLYARVLIFPFDLHTDRLLPPLNPFWYLITPGVMLLAVWIFIKGPRWARFCVLWYFLTLLPKSLLMMSGSFMSDHWAYHALPALVLPLALAFGRGWNSARKSRRLLSRSALALFLAAEVSLTLYNIQTRNTDEKLYRSALRFTNSVTMRYNLAMLLRRTGRLAEALAYLEPLYKEDPLNSGAGRALAACYWESERPAQAAALLREILSRDPGDSATAGMLQQMQRRPAQKRPASQK